MIKINHRKRYYPHSHSDIMLFPVIFFPPRMCERTSIAKRACTTPWGKWRNQVGSSNHLRWIKKSKCITVRFIKKCNLWKMRIFEARFLVLQWCQPPDPQKLEVLLYRWTSVVEPSFHMVNTQYAGIPVWVGRCCLSWNHHNISMCSGVDSVMLTPEVVCSVIYLHGLDEVNNVVRNNDWVVLLVCECVITITDI